MILVTGGNGFLGNHLVRLLVEKGERVRVLARPGSDLRSLAGFAVQTVEGDVRDPEDMDRLCDGVSGVIHTAAMVWIGWGMLREMREVNVAGTRRVARAARRAGVRMIHVSSVDALGLGTLCKPADETTPAGGKTACSYVVTKTEAETVMEDEILRGLDAVVVNPGFLLGPYDWKPSSGKMLLEVGKRAPLLAPAGGCSVADVRDVSAAILAALNRAKGGDRFILAGENVTYLELWRLFAKVAGRRGPFGRLGPVLRWGLGRGGDLLGRIRGEEPVVNSAALAMSNLGHYYSSAKARSELGYRNRSLEETVVDSWQWFSDHGYLAP
jgi:dihydroflavonol-4-reductase